MRTRSNLFCRGSISDKLSRPDTVVIGAAAMPANWHADMIADVGLDFIWIDREHGAYSDAEVELLSITARSAGIDSVVRLAPSGIPDSGRNLDIGATALMIPHVDSVEHAIAAVENAMYPPLGYRGAGAVGPSNRYGLHAEQELLSANDRCVIMAQIETSEAVQAADAIAAVPGISGLILGPADLSLSSGLAHGQRDLLIDHAMEAVQSAAERAGKWWGTVSGSPDLLRRARHAGARLLTIGSPRRLLRNAYTEMIEVVEEAR